MSREDSAGMGVKNRYGPLTLPDGVAGNMKDNSGFNNLVIHFNADHVNNNEVMGFIPDGAQIFFIYLHVDTVFTVTGTLPILEVGTGTPFVVGDSFTEAQLENTGTKIRGLNDTGFNGNFENAFSEGKSVFLRMGGTSPTISGGDARMIIEYSLVSPR